MPRPPDIGYWLNRKYENLEKGTEGEYQQRTAEAYKAREEGAQVAPDSASLRALREAQGFNLTSEGQLRQEQAATEAADRYATPFERSRAYYNKMVQQNMLTAPEGGVPLPATAPAAPLQQAAPLVPYVYRPQVDPALDVNRPPASITPRSNFSNALQPPPDQNQPPQSAPPLNRYQRRRQSLSGFARGTASVRPASGKGSKGGKGDKAGSSPKGLEAVLPALLAALQGGGATGLQAGGSPPGMTPGHAAPGGQSPPGFARGTVSIRSGKGGKGGKSSKGGSGPPKGLEAILPALLAASQASQMGSGAAGPQAADPNQPAMAPGSAASPGYAMGDSDISGQSDWSTDFGKLMARRNLGIGGAPVIPGAHYAPVSPGSSGQLTVSPNLGLPPGTTPLAASQFLERKWGPGNFNQPLNFGWATVTPQTDSVPRGFARGVPSVQPMPGYPFGAGYMLGANGANEVPGQGTGKTDTVPAMLAPHEAVLNRAAADMLGRGLIAALNTQGMRQMGMRRGATSGAS